MNLRWLPASFFRGLVCHRAPFYFEIRPYTPPKGALKAHRVCLRVYPSEAPVHAMAEWPFASVRNAKAYAQEVMRNPRAFGLGKAVAR
jgi:hypothetical protein